MWSVAVRRLALGVLDLAVRDACAGSTEASAFVAGPDFTVWAYVLGVPHQILRRAALAVDREGFPIWPQLAAEASAALASRRPSPARVPPPEPPGMLAQVPDEMHLPDVAPPGSLFPQEVPSP